MNALLPLLAETERTGVLWRHMPQAWVVGLLVVPLAIAVGWWMYRGETDVPRRARYLLGSLRTLALLFIAVLVFGPYVQEHETQTVRSHLLVLVDNSSSMQTVDGYDAADLERLVKVTGLARDQIGTLDRQSLARAVLTSGNHDLLTRLTERFRVHVFSFGSQLTPIVSTGDDTTDDTAAPSEDERAPVERVKDGLESLVASEPNTRLGQAVAMALDAFRLRDEFIGGVVVISDGQQNSGSLTPLQAGRKAAAQQVPVFSVGVGDPRSPMNIHVANLRAKEVVLARDEAVFEFTIRAKGFENRPVQVELHELDETGRPRGAPLPIRPNAVRLDGGDEEQGVRITHRFIRAGTYSLRIGVPVQDEEKIKSDNYVLHTLRVIDRKIKVLYVEDTPRNEFHFLSNALIRDVDTLRARTLLLTADPGAPQRTTRAAGWEPLDVTQGLPAREALFDYDVIIMGDVNWKHLAPTKDQALEALANIREFVEKGGGLIVISGMLNMPGKYKDTPLASVLPVIVDRTAEQTAPRADAINGFYIRMTPEGEGSPLMMVADTLEASKKRWQEVGPGERWDWRQRWAYPALRAKTLARVLAVADDRRLDNKFGPRPVIATLLYGRGRTLYLGVDELWLMRKPVGDRYFYRFYGEAIRFLATYKLKGGNKRFKIITDRTTYALDDAVRITLDVLDRDYNPARDETQTVTLEMPGAKPGTRETHELIVPAVPNEAGTYRKTIVATRAGDYKLFSETDDPEDERPERLFHVVQSTLEGRNLLLDEATLRELADSSRGGEYLRLWDLPGLEVEPRDRPVTTDHQDDELWDNAWSLLIALLLLGSEWLLRKRWQLV